jgi:hypothetical protein
MPKRCVALIVPMLLLATLAPGVQAADRRHHIRLIIRDTPIAKQGVKQTTAGLVSGAPFGNGVESIAESVTAATRTSVSIRGTIIIYTLQGSVSGTVSFGFIPAATGGATGSGVGRITGGTGRYAAAHGKFAFTGTEAPNSSVFVLHATGTVSY